MSDSAAHPPLPQGRAPWPWAAHAVLAGVAALFCAYAVFCLGALDETPMEAALRAASADALYPRLMLLPHILLGQAQDSVRVFSVICGLGALALMYRTGARLGHDPMSGAALALGFVLFPPVMGLFALAVPQAPAALVLMAGLSAVTAPRLPHMHQAVYAGLAAAFVGALHPVGAVAGVMLLIFAGLFWRRARPLLAAAAIMAVLVGLARTTWPETSALDALSAPKFPPLLGGVLLPYAMIWVGAALALPASFSPPVAARLGAALWPVRVCPLLFAAVPALSWAAGLIAAEHLLAAAAFGFVFGILAALPLVLWVRFVMPTVRAVAAWIAFPVIMYSCFWVVLGPVRQDRFPYSHMARVTGDSAVPGAGGWAPE